MSRYEKGHKADTHRRVVEIAAQRFRAEGVDGVGVASLMADAGLTHGGFYAHFASKEALVKEALILALSSSSAYAKGVTADPASPLDLRAYVDFYLSPAHRDKPATSCAMAALAPEVTRRPKATRAAFGKELQRLIARISTGLPEKLSPEHRLGLAYGIFAQLMGSLQLARVIADKALSDQVLALGRNNALAFAGLAQQPAGEKAAAVSKKR
ncbi:transcriptional regulator, TetR family [Methylocella silvestris BL2]|uniref:Transcriptional regulator, TetR family n=1 Tax=Methylocella silvestris (strain DSM 15510 / CIP 108128 / LMG 27833 / NCIMB 13906 / BL2) TaxID=395965 RepID=B8EIR7_METSB|nr:TetR/AcrR family transcriptional regulator [Methylocella silvestris]ACK51884.1 transcriptional regulator, TetR family [Methylocella silvestris BL2]